MGLVAAQLARCPSQDRYRPQSRRMAEFRRGGENFRTVREPRQCGDCELRQALGLASLNEPQAKAALIREGQILPVGRKGLRQYGVVRRIGSEALLDHLRRMVRAPRDK